MAILTILTIFAIFGSFKLNQSRSTTPMESLGETLFVIFGFLPLNDYPNVFSVCQDWSDISRDDNFWNYVYQLRFETDRSKNILLVDTTLQGTVNMRAFLRRLRLEAFFPKWKDELCRLLFQQSHISDWPRLYILIQRLNRTVWLKRNLFEGNIYGKIFQSLPTHLSDRLDILMIDLIRTIYFDNRLHFSLWKDHMYIAIFKLKNQDLLQIITPMLVQEFEDKIKKPMIMFQHSISYETVPLEIVQTIFEPHKTELLKQQSNLTTAIKFSSPTILKYLVINGFDPNQQPTPCLITLFSLTNSSESMLEKLKFLLTCSIDVNVVDRQGQSPLILVCKMTPQDEITRKMFDLLINYGANTSHKDSNGDSAISHLKSRILENLDSTLEASIIYPMLSKLK